MSADKVGAGEPSAQRPLAGFRVLDFTNMMAGPYCTRWLADMGAEVIKVEPPEGDHNRSRRPVRQGVSTGFGHLNAGKKSVALDLKKPQGLEAARALAQHCDVVVENWSPGVADRLGVGYAALSALKPNLVYCSISGFGQSGPSSRNPAFAAIVHASSGYDLAQADYQGGGRPAKTGTFIADTLAAQAAFGAIQAALLHRERSGRGQYIDVALMDCMMNLMAFEYQEVQTPMNEKVRVYTPTRALDGYVVTAPTSQKNFENMARAMGHPEWILDPRFAKTRQREGHWGELMELVESWTARHSGQHCEEVLNAAGVPTARFRTIAEAIRDPQFEARGSFSTVRDSVGAYQVPNMPFQMPGLQVSVQAAVPGFGEHTDAVLGELLGYSEEEARACR
jgi:crotonobetainyl-CoA:carnitine CoA-transferase CaiB-like acyl-CoA transferase